MKDDLTSTLRIRDKASSLGSPTKNLQNYNNEKENRTTNEIENFEILQLEKETKAISKIEKEFEVEVPIQRSPNPITNAEVNDSLISEMNTKFDECAFLTSVIIFLLSFIYSI